MHGFSLLVPLALIIENLQNLLMGVIEEWKVSCLFLVEMTGAELELLVCETWCCTYYSG